MTIVYAREQDLSTGEFLSVLFGSGLAERRPVDQPERIAEMLTNADLTVTARDRTGRIVGVARSVTDWSYCLYCSDLAVDRPYQGRGIGKRLLSETAALAPGVKSFLLVSAPAAAGFYEKAGYERLPDTFLFHSNR